MNNGKINIAHIFLTLEIGGMEKVGLELIQGLSDQFNNYVICLDSLGVFGEELKGKGYSVINLNKGQGYSVRIISDLIKIFRKNKIQIVHTNNPAPHFWGSLAAILAGVKVRIHTKHGRNFPHLKRRVFLNRVSAIFSSWIVCVSRDAALLTRQKEKVADKKIRVIHNGIHCDEFYPVEKNQSILAEFNLGQKNQILGSIARFNRDKDQKTLVLAFNKLLKDFPDARLLMIGDGETFEEIQTLVRRMQLSKKISMPGYRSDIKEILSVMDVYILSSHTEGLSISLLEAMSMEIPCIATDVGGNREIITNEVDGFLVKENDVNGLYQQMKKLLDERETSEKTGRESRKTILQNFSISSMIKNYENLYLNSIRN